MSDAIELLAAAVRDERAVWPQGLDPHAAVRAADEHGLLMLLDRTLPSIDAPPQLHEALRPLVRERTERALLLVRQLRTLVSLLDAAGIAAVPVKGPLLAMTAYGHAAMRGASGDLDLIVRPADLARAVATLEAAHYRRVEPALHEHDPASWLREAHLFPPSASIGTLVELHTELSGIDVDAAMQRATRTRLLGHDFSLLATEDQLLYLSLHAAQHIWRRLIWTADVAAMIRNTPIDWTILLERAAAIDATHRLAVTLRLAVDLFHAAVPADVQSRLFAGARIAHTAKLARRWIEQTAAGTKIPEGFSGVLLRARSEWAIRETRAQRRAWLLSSIAPNAVDRAAFPLPRGLRFLRWILHPLRLLFRHAR